MGALLVKGMIIAIESEAAPDKTQFTQDESHSGRQTLQRKAVSQHAQECVCSEGTRPRAPGPRWVLTSSHSQVSAPPSTQLHHYIIGLRESMYCL